MGVNCPDVRVVIHLGPPDYIESYIQETGRGGREGHPSQAILYTKRNYSQTVCQDMKTYCQNNMECRRYLLFCNMEGYNSSLHRVCSSNCCDICFRKVSSENPTI